mmetsp:Transcript_22544/g.33715  ORF Transcript_22544/g.33715 Transcript_22544/m.33715 type:complete len:423 (+) Transcript_22544:69-1337(+)
MIDTAKSSRSCLLCPLTSLTAIMMFASCVLWCSPIVSIDAFTHPSSQNMMTSRTTSSITKIHSTKDIADEQSNVVERVRAAVFQAPVSQSENPLEILTEVADSLRVASLHGVDVVVYPELYLSGPNNSKALDRESYELNIVGNMCGELNVACIIGYVEAVHESELKKNNDDSSGDGKAYAYNSIAAFHADGSRAGNYRSVTASTFGGKDCREGSPFVEFIPTTLKLPNRKSEQSSGHEREIKVGMMCGNDILKPVHSLHLVRCGAQILLAPCSFKNNNNDLRVLEYVTATRAIENSVPFVFANRESATTTDDVKDKDDFIGSSAIISQDGEYLVCGPEEGGGDMPSDSGYLIPCKDGVIYAADIEVDTNSTSSVIQQSIDQWDLNPLIPDVFGDKRSKEKKRESNGFGNFTGKKNKGKKIKK